MNIKDTQLEDNNHDDDSALTFSNQTDIGSTSYKEEKAISHLQAFE